MPHILAVDDEPHIRELIDVILTAEGHVVAHAADGIEALEAVERSIPDLIVLDLAMPGMDGWRFLEELYVRGLRRKTRVVIISGQSDEYPPHDAAPTRHFLQKPFDPRTLVALVNDALEQEPAEVYEKRERSSELGKLLRKIESVIGTP